MPEQYTPGRKEATRTRRAQGAQGSPGSPLRGGLYQCSLGDHSISCTFQLCQLSCIAQNNQNHLHIKMWPLYKMLPSVLCMQLGTGRGDEEESDSCVTPFIRFEFLIMYTINS